MHFSDIHMQQMILEKKFIQLFCDRTPSLFNAKLTLGEHEE